MAPKKKATKAVTGKKIKLNGKPKGEKVSSMTGISTGRHIPNLHITM
jgi:hypothetical protein